MVNPKVIAEIIDERNRQTIVGEAEHDPFVHLAILGERVGEANYAALNAHLWETEGWDVDKLKILRTELIQVAAVAESMVECLDRQILG